MRNQTHKAWQQPQVEDHHYYIECGMDDKKLRIEFGNNDPLLTDWREAFESVLSFLQFGPESIKELFASEDMIHKQCLEDVVCLNGYGNLGGSAHDCKCGHIDNGRTGYGVK